ncbi:MAG: FKBP-type peptidyl-prolyl cis-trans isomerase [Acidimicrobiales bacterium]
MSALPSPFRRAVLAVVLALPLLAAACSDDSSVTTADGASGWTSSSGKAPGAPTITAPRGAAPKQLVVDDLTEGTGDTAVANGMIALVDYTGANYSNGKVFDASYGRAPFPVTVGAGTVIKGWDQGLLGMKVGGKRQLVIPPDLGYGAQAQGDIPANETLIFIVELRALLQRPTPEAVPGGTVDALQTQDLAPGYGTATAKAGDQVSLHYVGVHGATGAPFDASWDHGEPITIKLGAGQVIPGWDQGIVGMKLGGRRRLIIPAALAYGAEGRPPTIGPNETLVFDVDLVGLGS